MLLAFFESDISTRSCGYDLIMLPADDARDNLDEHESNRIILMKSNLTSFVERKDKAAVLEQSMLNISNTLRSDVKPLNICLKSTSKRIMFFGSSSRQSEIAAPNAATIGPDGEIEDVDVRLSNDGEDDVVVLVDDAKEQDENDDDIEDMQTTRESLDERGSFEGSVVSSSRNTTVGGRLDRVPTGINRKTSKLPSMFNFMSSSSIPSAASATTPEQVLALSAAPLRELLELLKYVHADAISGAMSCVTPTTAASATITNPFSFQPGSTSSDDYLSHAESISLCSTWKVNKQVEGAGVSTANPANTSTPIGLWLSQWRIRRALLCTTAFVDWSESVANLKNLNLRTLRLMSNEEKLCFCINLYNLICLHASILMPWPKLTDRLGRIVWMKNARYQIGSGTISLLQLEHCLLRANLCNVDLPTFLSTEVLTIHVHSLVLFVCLLACLLACLLIFRIL